MEKRGFKCTVYLFENNIMELIFTKLSGTVERNLLGKCHEKCKMTISILKNPKEFVCALLYITK